VLLDPVLLDPVLLDPVLLDPVLLDPAPLDPVTRASARSTRRFAIASNAAMTATGAATSRNSSQPP
jgi:hypothetical protein